MKSKKNLERHNNKGGYMMSELSGVFICMSLFILIVMNTVDSIRIDKIQDKVNELLKEHRKDEQ